MKQRPVLIGLTGNIATGKVEISDTARITGRVTGEAIAVAETAVVQAEELYRIEQARFDVRDNTATDLVAAKGANQRTMLRRNAAPPPRNSARGRAGPGSR